MREQFHHLDQFTRDRIKALLDEGYSLRKIGRTLDITHSTISREINRNSYGTDKRTSSDIQDTYSPSAAQVKAYVRRKYAKYEGKKIEENKTLRSFIIAKLAAHWSPDEVAGHMKLHVSCTSDACLYPDEGSGCSGGTIYASKTAVYDWLRSEWGQPYCEHLYSKRYKKKPRKAKKTDENGDPIEKPRAMVPERVSIHDRPEHINDRSEAGHWEKDAVVSSKHCGSKAALSVNQERMSRFLAVHVLPDMKPDTHVRTVSKLLTFVRIKSITYDNGIENRRHTELRAQDIDTFFTDPYSSWQKGGVENGNKMIRRYYPKGTDFATIGQTEVDAVTRIINNKPRKILGYRSALHIAHKEGVLREGGAFGG